MSENERLQVFERELNTIQDPVIKGFAEKALLALPDYFYTIPASTTGKYHPASSLGEGGLVRHTKTALKIAESLFRFETLGKFNDRQKDLIRVAILLHDGVKCGLNGSKYTVHEHPMLAGKLIRDLEIPAGMTAKEVVAIAEGVEAHMSQWNTDPRSKVVLPLPEKPYQVFVALCDYLSAQKIFNIEVDGYKLNKEGEE